MVSKFQHLVFYVNDLDRSKSFYTELLNTQFSATNHPDSSAAMKLSQYEMRFLSFGFYHHDICLIKSFKWKADNDSLLHYSMVARNASAFEQVRLNAGKMCIPLREGRMLASAQMQPGWEAFCFSDPDGHWVEVLLK